MSTRYRSEPVNRHEDFLRSLRDPRAGKSFVDGSIPYVKVTVADGQIPYSALTVEDGEIPRSKVADTLVSATLPSSPVDGDEFYYLANATVGVIWRFRYRAASGSAYKWELVGGEYLVARTDTLETETTTASYGDLSGGATGPSVTLPFAGDYVMEFGCACANSTAGQACIMAPQTATTAAVDNNAILHTSGAANAFGQPSRSDVTFTGQPASSVLIAKYKVTGGTGSFLRRWIKTRPIRVG
jgi:hypothetical protein